MNGRIPLTALSVLALSVATFSASILAGPKPAEKPPEKSAEAAPMAMFRIGTDIYTAADYASFLQRNSTIVSEAMTSDVGKVNAVREMIAGHVLRDQLFKDGLLKKKDELTQKEIAAAYEELAKRHFPIPPTPSEEKAYKYYEDHPVNYGIPRMVRLNQMMFKVPRGADDRVRQAARTRAEEGLKRLDKGEGFAKLAVELTENPVGRVAGGDIGFVYLKEKPWLEQALADKKKGEHSGVLESPDGFEILQVTDERPALITPYANVRDKVMQQLKDEEQKVLRDAYVKDLAKAIPIEILDPNLKLLMPEGAF